MSRSSFSSSSQQSLEERTRSKITEQFQTVFRGSEKSFIDTLNKLVQDNSYSSPAVFKTQVLDVVLQASAAQITVLTNMIMKHTGDSLIAQKIFANQTAKGVLLEFAQNGNEVVKERAIIAIANIVASQEGKIVFSDQETASVLLNLVKSGNTKLLKQALAAILSLVDLQKGEEVFANKKTVEVLLNLAQSGSEEVKEIVVEAIAYLNTSKKMQGAFSDEKAAVALFKLAQSENKKVKAHACNAIANIVSSKKGKIAFVNEETEKFIVQLSQSGNPELQYLAVFLSEKLLKILPNKAKSAASSSQTSLDPQSPTNNDLEIDQIEYDMLGELPTHLGVKKILADEEKIQPNQHLNTSQVLRTFEGLEYPPQNIVCEVNLSEFVGVEIFTTEALNQAIQNVLTEEENDRLILLRVASESRGFVEDEAENNHFVALHFTRDRQGLKLTYIDPTGREISSQLKEVLTNNPFLSGAEIVSSRTSLQFTDPISEEAAIYQMGGNDSDCGVLVALAADMVRRNHWGKDRVMLSETSSRALGQTLRQITNGEKEIEEVSPLIEEIFSGRFMEKKLLEATKESCDLKEVLRDREEVSRNNRLELLKARAAILLRDKEDFTCPISQEIFINPVMTAAGHSYERDSINQHLQSNRTDPKTRADLGRRPLLIPNFSLKSAVLDYVSDVKKESLEVAKEFLDLGFVEDSKKMIERAKELNDNPAFHSEEFSKEIDEMTRELSDFRRNDTPSASVNYRGVEAVVSSQGIKGLGV